MTSEVDTPLPVVVLISGRGSNMGAILDRCAGRGCGYRVAAVISDRPGAAGLVTARGAGIPGLCVDRRDYLSRQGFETALIAAIERHRPGLIALAGFMRVLSAAFVARFAGRILNIHPSLLPDYRGLDTHARVLAAGEREHGASVHFVTEELDGGPVAIQARVQVGANDDEERLAERVLHQEHRIYPLAIEWFAHGRLRLEDDAVVLDGVRRQAPVVCHAADS